VIRKSLCLGLVVVSTLVFACGSSSDREGFEDGAGNGNGPTAGNGNGTDNTSLGTEPPPVPPAEPEECTKMDIIFVVDDSGSMAEEQANLAANFPKFVSKIDSFKTKGGSKLDWRIAVTTTARDITYNISLPIGGSVPMSEKGDDGAFRMTPECKTTKRWVEKSDANASEAFRCLAKAGTGGSSIEMPLYATKLALVDRMADGTNAGFLRDDALLAVVVLTDEDDCSREDNNFTIQNDVCATMADLRPVSEYKQMLDTVAKGAGRWATAVIAGQTACESSFGKASEAVRLKEFVGLAGKNGTFSSICDGDLSNALEKALDTFDAACKTLPPSQVN
jgi:hypothetical protein